MYEKKCRRPAVTKRKGWRFGGKGEPFDPMQHEALMHAPWPTGDDDLGAAVQALRDAPGAEVGVGREGLAEAELLGALAQVVTLDMGDVARAEVSRQRGDHRLMRPVTGGRAVQRLAVQRDHRPNDRRATASRAALDSAGWGKGTMVVPRSR